MTISKKSYQVLAYENYKDWIDKEEKNFHSGFLNMLPTFLYSLASVRYEEQWELLINFFNLDRENALKRIQVYRGVITCFRRFKKNNKYLRKDNKLDYELLSQDIFEESKNWRVLCGDKSLEVTVLPKGLIMYIITIIDQWEKN